MLRLFLNRMNYILGINNKRVRFNLVPYDKQYETRDFVNKFNDTKKNINYFDTEAFWKYKPNLKSNSKTIQL